MGYGGVWWGMVGYGGVWWGMVGYGRVWWGMVGYGGVWWGMEYFPLFRLQKRILKQRARILLHLFFGKESIDVVLNML